MTTYLILITYQPGHWESVGPDERQAFHDQHHAFDAAVGEHLLGGEALADPDTATTLRRVDGHTVLTDGPFAETAEIIGGFYLVRAPHLDQVVEWCELLPASYTLEIRPCIQIEGYAD